MAVRQIPEGAVEIQTGLWLHTIEQVLVGNTYTLKYLYSSEGYCFYDNTVAEDERIYYQWMSLGLLSDVNNFTSIPISELPSDANIAGNPTKPEIA